MDEQDAQRERHDYFLQRRGHGLSYYDGHVPWGDEEPDRLASSPYDIGRGILRWGGIALGCWAVISGGLYLGYVVIRTIIFGPDIF